MATFSTLPNSWNTTITDISHSTRMTFGGVRDLIFSGDIHRKEFGGLVSTAFIGKKTRVSRSSINLNRRNQTMTSGVVYRSYDKRGM